MHKKTYLTERDWLSIFKTFEYDAMLLTEFKNSLLCHFADVYSAFGYLQTFCGQERINLDAFSRAVQAFNTHRTY